jgi:hypothetical protein
MLFLPALCLSICIATIEARLGATWRLNGRSNWSCTKKASCALDHSFLPNNVSINQVNLMGTNRLS